MPPKRGLLENPQMDWRKVYQANMVSETASYVLYDDVIKDNQFTANTIGNLNLPENFRLDFGITYRQLKSKNFAKIHDLLGAESHEDIDHFSNTLNDVQGNISKAEKRGFQLQLYS